MTTPSASLASIRRQQAMAMRLIVEILGGGQVINRPQCLNGRRWEFGSVSCGTVLLDDVGGDATAS
jgi:hypothetical protein